MAGAGVSRSKVDVTVAPKEFLQAEKLSTAHRGRKRLLAFYMKAFFVHSSVLERQKLLKRRLL